MDPEPLKAVLRRDGKLSLRVRVIPKSQRTEWAGVMDDGALKVRLHAVPEKGKANEELVRFLAAELGVARSHIDIVAGATSQNKHVRVTVGRTPGPQPTPRSARRRS